MGTTLLSHRRFWPALHLVQRSIIARIGRGTRHSVLTAMTTVTMHMHTLTWRLSRHWHLHLHHLHLRNAYTGDHLHLLLIVLVHQGHLALVHRHLRVHLGHEHLLSHKRSGRMLTSHSLLVVDSLI